MMEKNGEFVENVLIKMRNREFKLKISKVIEDKSINYRYLFEITDSCSRFTKVLYIFPSIKS